MLIMVFNVYAQKAVNLCRYCRLPERSSSLTNSAMFSPLMCCFGPLKQRNIASGS